MSVTTPGDQRAMRIAITSGKGGVGKTSLTVNLAVATAHLGFRVGVLDADFSLGDVATLLGLQPEQHLGTVLAGTCPVTDVALDGPAGIRIIPAGNGVRQLTKLDDPMWARLSEIVDEAGRDLDYLFIDTESGIADNVLRMVGLADHVVVVTRLDPAAVVDGYTLIKLVSVADPAKPIGVVVNAAEDADEGTLVFRQFASAARRFLGRSLRYEGHVPADPAVRDSSFSRTPFVGSPAASEADRHTRRIARRLVQSLGVSRVPAAPMPVTTPDASREVSPWP